MAQKMEEAVKTMPKLADSQSWANSKYYKGGFDPKMNKREAALILGKFNLILLSYFGSKSCPLLPRTSVRCLQFTITCISTII
jgi:hypothetical protein